MRGKRYLLVLVIIVLAFTGCSKNEKAEVSEGPVYTDGIYFAQEAEFAGNGWKYVATIEVKDGKIVKADWNGANINGGEDKKSVSAGGRYNMVAFGGAQAEWHVQAGAAEAFLLEKQDPAAISYKDDEGHTDDISGVSIHVIEFFKLAEEALAAGPVGRGPFKDGHFHAEETSFSESNGWRYCVDLTVINGFIVSANWNGGNVGGGVDKKTSSASGAYGMVAYSEATKEWHEQAMAAEAFLLEKQDPTAISYKDDAGHTDDIAGVSIHVIEFFKLAEEALAAGPVSSGPYANGTYHAEEPAFNERTGWKSTVDMTVIDGNIFAVNWSAVNAEGLDKKTASKEGAYGMVANGGAQAEWHVQAMATEAYLLKTQDPTKISYKDEDGHTDDIAGVSVHVSDFYTLVEAALAAGPVKSE
ncbi:MAG: hypothetical protein JEY99_01100 [Spirochaetales bacterium]|nr:hypothetical protein [Spirochaetales bacterium]